VAWRRGERTKRPRPGMRFNLRRPTPTRADRRPTKKEVTAAVTLSVTQWVAAVAGTKWRAFVEQSGRKQARREAAQIRGMGKSAIGIGLAGLAVLVESPDPPPAIGGSGRLHRGPGSELRQALSIGASIGRPLPLVATNTTRGGRALAGRAPPTPRAFLLSTPWRNTASIITRR
jgi:hypothetical protein